MSEKRLTIKGIRQRLPDSCNVCFGCGGPIRFSGKPIRMTSFNCAPLNLRLNTTYNEYANERHPDCPLEVMEVVTDG